jgi:hypothetical protein
MGQGNLKPDKTRGDLLITVTIPKGPLFKWGAKGPKWYFWLSL